MLARIAQRLEPARKLAICGAWFFIAVSLAHVLWVIATKWDDPAGTFKLYHVGSHNAFGLTYSGTLGLLTAIGQAGLVTAAAVASVLAAGRMLRYRRLGHVFLVGWSALWAADLILLAAIDHEWVTAAKAALLSALLCCTTGRAFMGWSPKSFQTKPPEPPATGPDRDTEFDHILRAGVGLPKPKSPAPPPAAVEPPPPTPRSVVARRLKAIWSRIVTLVKRIAGSQRLSRTLTAVRRGIAAILCRLSTILGGLASRLRPEAESTSR